MVAIKNVVKEKGSHRKETCKIETRGEVYDKILSMLCKGMEIVIQVILVSLTQRRLKRMSSF